MSIVDDMSIRTGVVYSDEQRKILEHEGGMNILACAGSGKALTNNTEVITSNGLVRIGDIAVGDIVYGLDGKEQTVVGVYPQGKKFVYRVIFSDGNVVDCNDEHLWTVKIGDNWEIISLRSLLDRDFIFRDGDYGSYEASIAIEMPIAKALDIRRHDSIPSYVAYNIGHSLDFNRGCNTIFSAGIDAQRAFVKGAYKRAIEEGMSIYAPTLDLARQAAGYCGICFNEFDNMGDSPCRTLVKVIKLNKSEEMTCIKVSNTDGLFVLGNGIVTHNTTVLTHLIAKRIASGEISNPSKLLCTTFSKAGANEMEERLGALLNKLGIKAKVSVKTLHATYFQVLKKFGIMPNVCTNSQRSMFISKAIRDSHLMLEDDDIRLVDSLISYQVNNLMDDSSLVKSYVYTLDDVSLEQYTEIRQRYNKLKSEAGVIDFDDMQLYMYLLIVQQKNPDVLAYCRNQWEYFYIDEFQDVSKIQFAIVRELVQDPNKLVVIGDDDQCIYEWRGADPNIILNICGYYDIQKFILSTNYRCKGKIVNTAAVGIKHNQKRSNKDMIPFNDGGSIKICDTGPGNLFEISKRAYEHITSLVWSGTDPADIAVLSRNNQHLCILNNMLFKAGIYSDASSDMQFTGMSMYKDIKNVMELSDGTFSHLLVDKILWKLIPYLGTAKAKMFVKFMDIVGCDFKLALHYIISKYSYRSIDGVDDRVYKLKVPSKVAGIVERDFYKLNKDSENYLIHLANLLNIEDEGERFKAVASMYLVGTEFLYKTLDRSRTVHGVVAYIEHLIEQDGYEGAKTFLNLTEQYETGKATVPDNKVTMSTMHGAKGREWKNVVLFADDNISFPSFEGIERMISDKIDEKDISDSIDENRRLHYVAMTRAKDELVIFADISNLSIYTMEALGIIQNDGTMFNRNIIELATNGLNMEYVDKIRNLVLNTDSEYYYKARTFSSGVIDGLGDEYDIL